MPPELTDRQKQCLRGILELKSAKQIGRDLGISAHAVEKHLKAARQKLGAADSVGAARLYAKTLDGTELPYYGKSDLCSLSNRWSDVATESGRVADLSPPSPAAADRRGGAYEFTAFQTIGLILLSALGLAIILGLFIAMAQAVDFLTS
jgi:DNA-binding CsgD family transcriptional regulator